MSPCSEDTGCGCGCATESEAATPWDMQSATINQALMTLPIVIGTYAIARYRARKLLIYLPAVIAFLTVWRRYACARCQYYGKECSTLFGLATAKMMPRDTEHELDRQGMTIDLAYIGLLGIMPMRQVLKRPLLAIVYLVAYAGGFGAILINACGRCGNEFCPMKDLRRMVEDKIG